MRSATILAQSDPPSAFFLSASQYVENTTPLPSRLNFVTNTSQGPEAVD